MGKASHKLAGSYVSVHTLMSVEQVLDLAEMVAREVMKRRPDKPGPVVKTSRNANAAEFAVVNIRKRAVMRFQVRGVPSQNGGGGTDLTSRITFFTTLQQQMLGFIPAGPKRLNGWPGYSTFMESLEGAIKDADRSSRTSIVTAAG